MDPCGGRRPTSQVELAVSCRNLPDRDLTSDSDPFCVLFARRGGSSSYVEVGRTEALKNNQNPSWSKKFILEYLFQERYELQFKIFDQDSSSNSLSRHDFLGLLECSLGEIIACGGRQFTRSLTKALSGRPIITIIAEEVASCKEEAHMQFSGRDLEKKDTFGKSDPFLVFSRSNADGSYSVVHRTEVMPNTLSPAWRPFSISVQKLCNGDYNRSIKMECFDWDTDGTHDLIGEALTTLTRLSEGPNSNGNRYELVNPRKMSKKKHYKNSGILMLRTFNVGSKTSFLEYVKSGTQIHFTVAVDFTASNGNPQDPNSLHFRNPNGINPYVIAIRAVGEIVQDYDTDKQFPALGFGAQVPPSMQVLHEFHLNGHPDNPYCVGVDGVLQAYYSALSRVTLSGPTNFAPVIRHVSRIASANTSGKDYYILLIITDGAICDMDETKEALVRASSLPMSLIIVGVGNADFSAMDALDADRNPLSSKGARAHRDIVQFVAMRSYMGMDWERQKATLAADVLREIPNQLTSYMGSRPPVPTGSTHSAYLPSGGPLNPGSSASIYPQNPPPSAPGYPQGLPPSASGYPQDLPPSAPGYPQDLPSSAPGYPPNPTPPASGYPQYPPSSASGYPPNPASSASGYPQYPPSSAPGYPPNPASSTSGYPQYPPSSAPGYPPNPASSTSGYPQYPPSSALAYPPNPTSSASGYPQYPPSSAPGYPPNPASSASGYPQYPPSSTPGYPSASFPAGYPPNPSSTAPGYPPHPASSYSGYPPQPSSSVPGYPAGSSHPAQGFPPASTYPPNQQPPLPGYPGYSQATSNPGYPMGPPPPGNPGYPPNPGSSYPH